MICWHVHCTVCLVCWHVHCTVCSECTVCHACWHLLYTVNVRTVYSMSGLLTWHLSGMLRCILYNVYSVHCTACLGWWHIYTVCTVQYVWYADIYTILYVQYVWYVDMYTSICKRTKPYWLSYNIHQVWMLYKDGHWEWPAGSHS